MHRVKLFLVVWGIGSWGGILFYLLRLHGTIQVSGYESEKFKPDPEKGLVVLFRHPSMKEVMILPMLFFPRYLFHPSLLPYQTPDIRWYRLLPFLRHISIPIERGNGMAMFRALKAMKAFLRTGGTLLVAPEGGRTWKGAEFKHLVGGRVCVTSSPNERSIRPFKSGIGSLLSDGTPVVVVWLEPIGRWGLKIQIGARHSFDTSFPRKQIPVYLENMMLRTAVEE